MDETGEIQAVAEPAAPPLDETVRLPEPPPATEIPLSPRGEVHPFGEPPPAPPPPLRAGDLTSGWRTALISGWLGVLVGLGSVWQACRIGGIAPWWLGPETNLRSPLVIAIPFVLPLAALAAAFAAKRFASYLGIIAGVVTAAISLGDVGEFKGLALVEAVIGVAGLMISVASLAGRVRAEDLPPPHQAGTDQAGTDQAGTDRASTDQAGTDQAAST
ncbi:MAG TPA: hypothetical protein VGM78_03835 [Ilumatobacteraceae bacterium]